MANGTRCISGALTHQFLVKGTSTLEMSLLSGIFFLFINRYTHARARTHTHTDLYNYCSDVKFLEGGEKNNQGVTSTSKATERRPQYKVGYIPVDT